MATVGGRYSTYEQTQGGYQYGYYVGPTVSPLTGSESERRFTPKYLLKYTLSPDVNFYAVASQGFRPGGSQTPPPTTVCGADYQTLNLTPDQLSSFKGDTVWNYELGAKIRLHDPRITINTSIFSIDWDNTRQTLVLPCTYSALVNSGKARSRGGEIEIAARVSENLNTTLAVGYTDAKILTAGALVSVPAAGSQIQQVAPITASASADYRHALTTDIQWFSRVDYSYTDRSYSATITAGSPRVRPPYGMLNLRIGITRGAWEAALVANNVQNTRPNYGDYLSLFGEAPGRPRWMTSLPRSFGVDLRSRF